MALLEAPPVLLAPLIGFHFRIGQQLILFVFHIFILFVSVIFCQVKNTLFLYDYWQPRKLS